MTIEHMRIAWWIPNTTNTHLGYVTLIAFPLQQWLHESASMLRYTYIACLVTCSFLRVTLHSLFSDKNLMHFSSPICVLRAQRLIFSFIQSSKQDLVKHTNCSTFIEQFSAVKASSSLFNSNILLSSATRKTQSHVLSGIKFGTHREPWSKLCPRMI
jgi:hypothetical protein